MNQTVAATNASAGMAAMMAMSDQHGHLSAEFDFGINSYNRMTAAGTLARREDSRTLTLLRRQTLYPAELRAHKTRFATDLPVARSPWIRIQITDGLLAPEPQELRESPRQA